LEYKSVSIRLSRVDLRSVLHEFVTKEIERGFNLIEQIERGFIPDKPRLFSGLIGFF